MDEVCCSKNSSLNGWIPFSLGPLMFQSSNGGKNVKLGGGFKHLLFLTPTWRNDPI